MFKFKIKFTPHDKNSQFEEVEIPKNFESYLLYCVYLDPSTPMNIKGNILATIIFAATHQDNNEKAVQQMIEDLIQESLRQSQPFIKLEHQLLALEMAEEMG